MINRILERLEEEREIAYADFDKYANDYELDLEDTYDDFFHKGLERAKKIVREVAKEYGWVSVKDRLPEVQDEYLVWWTADGFKGKCFYEIVEYHPEEGWIGKIPQAPFGKYTIIAWQALAPYQKGE